MPIEQNAGSSAETDPVYTAEKPTLATKTDLQAMQNLTLAMITAMGAD